MKNKNGLENTLRYITSALAGIGAGIAIDMAAPDYAYAEEAKSNVASMKSEDGKNCHTLPEQVIPERKVCEATKPAPKKAPKKKPAPKDDCYNLTFKEAGAKELPLENKYGEEGKCSYRSAQIEAGKEYVLSLNDANEFFNDNPVANPIANIEAVRTFYDNNGMARSIAFKAKGNVSLTANLTNKNGGVETDDELELIVKNAEAKKEEPKKEDFTPVPAPKPAEQQPAPVAEEESSLDLDFDIAAEADMGFVQNTQNLSGSQIVYSGLRTGVLAAPSIKLDENISLGAYGKYAFTDYLNVEANGASSEGSEAVENQFGGGLLLNIKGNEDKTSRAGDLKVVFGGGYLGAIQEMNYMGYHFEQNQNGGDFMIAVNAPRLIYPMPAADASEDLIVGLEGSTYGRVLRTSQNGPAGEFDRGARFDVKGNLALNATFNDKLKAKLGWGGTSMDSLLVDAGRRNGSHLLVGVGSPDNAEGFGWGIEGTMPYGVDNDEYGVEACIDYNGFRFCADGKRYSMPTETGNGDSAGNQTINTGIKASYSTDFDMKLVKALNKIFGGN